MGDWEAMRTFWAAGLVLAAATGSAALADEAHLQDVPTSYLRQVGDQVLVMITPPSGDHGIESGLSTQPADSPNPPLGGDAARNIRWRFPRSGLYDGSSGDLVWGATYDTNCAVAPDGIHMTCASLFAHAGSDSVLRMYESGYRTHQVVAGSVVEHFSRLPVLDPALGACVFTDAHFNVVSSEYTLHTAENRTIVVDVNTGVWSLSTSRQSVIALAIAILLALVVSYFRWRLSKDLQPESG